MTSEELEEKHEELTQVTLRIMEDAARFADRRWLRVCYLFRPPYDDREMTFVMDVGEGD